MKKIQIISLGHATGSALKWQIESLIGQYVKVVYTLLSHNDEADWLSDLIIFTSEFGFRSSKQLLPKGCRYIVSGRVINHKSLEAIITLPYGTDVLLVNDCMDTSYQAIEQLKELGLDHVNYYPYYPNCAEYPKLKTAITPGEPQIAPGCVERLIDIGIRILDIRSIHLILEKLELSDMFQESLTISYIKDIVAISKSIEINRRNARESERMLSVILDNVETGIGFLDNDLNLLRYNKKLEDLLKRDAIHMQSVSLAAIIPNFDAVVLSGQSHVTTLNNEDFLLQIESMDEGHLLMLEPVEKIFRQDHVAKRVYESKLRTKLYNLQDYMTKDKAVLKMLEKVRRFAVADATVLIQGENGTGKEILAQGIHVESDRRDKPFIPINIASISPTLLESELFGYVEGAFTGAKRGGKAGLFEIADSGTLFIDEIGDAPLDIQARLLRVLQERKVRRVGADQELPVDVRIIAATNKDLLMQVEEGAFRRDLFFRLNILPVRTIPLRQRKDDIPYLLTQSLRRNLGKMKIELKDVLTDEANVMLMQYSWRGNVREMLNIVEYIRYIYDGVPLGADELPDYLMQHRVFKERILLDRSQLTLLHWIAEYHGIGRKRLHQLALDEGIELGEGKIRSILDQMKEQGLITIGVDARGCVVSELGERTLQDYMNG